MSNKKCLVVLSGGLDSTVTAYKLKKDGYELRAVYLDYGKPIAKKEISAAKLIALYLNIPLEIVELHGFMKMELGYLPWEKVKTDEADVEKGADHLASVSDEAEKYLATFSAGNPNWYKITGFHTLVSISTYLAQIVNFNAIALGITNEQIVLSPSLKRYIDSWGNIISDLNSEVDEFKIITPLEKLTKDKIVELGNKLHAPLDITWSCPNDFHDYQCGVCKRCIERKNAFKKAMIKDLTRYNG